MRRTEEFSDSEKFREIIRLISFNSFLLYLSLIEGKAVF